MKKFLGVATALALLGMAGAASADEASGTIQSVDPDARTIVLEDGSTFTVGEAVDLESLSPGTEVTVSYEEQDGTKTATEVAPAE